MAELPFAVEPLAFIVTGAVASTAGYPASNLAELKHVGMVWRTTETSSVYIAGDFGDAKVVDFCSVLRASATAGMTWRLRLGNDPTFASTLYDSGAGGVPFISPSITRDDGLYGSHLDTGTSVTARYFRIDFGSVTAALEASAIVFGKKLIFANYYSPGFEFGVQDLGDIDFGRWGIPDETDGLIFRRLTCKFGWMSQSDMDTMFRPLAERIGKRKPLLFCLDPAATTNRQARTYFGWMKDPPFFSGAVNKFDRYESEYSVISMI